MNRYLILISLVLLDLQSFGIEKVYIKNYPYPLYNSNGCYCYNCSNARNLYYNSYAPYLFQRTTNYTSATPKQKRLQRIRRLQKMKKNISSVNWFNNFKNGVMTGYSVPVTSDVYKQMGITPYSPNSKTRANSINCNQELFSTPSGNETYYKDGTVIRDLKGANGKMGVTIIYD